MASALLHALPSRGDADTDPPSETAAMRTLSRWLWGPLEQRAAVGVHGLAAHHGFTLLYAVWREALHARSACPPAPSADHLVRDPDTAGSDDQDNQDDQPVLVLFVELLLGQVAREEPDGPGAEDEHVGARVQFAWYAQPEDADDLRVRAVVAECVRHRRDARRARAGGASPVTPSPVGWNVLIQWRRAGAHGAEVTGEQRWLPLRMCPAVLVRSVLGVVGPLPETEGLRMLSDAVEFDSVATGAQSRPNTSAVLAALDGVLRSGLQPRLREAHDAAELLLGRCFESQGWTPLQEYRSSGLLPGSHVRVSAYCGVWQQQQAERWGRWRASLADPANAPRVEPSSRGPFAALPWWSSGRAFRLTCTASRSAP